MLTGLLPSAAPTYERVLLDWEKSPGYLNKQSLRFGENSGSGIGTVSCWHSNDASLRTSSSAALQERVFENKIPSHIPIKIKIKKEKEQSFKDLKNEKWLRGFELELTNTGDKAIYFVYITMGTNVKIDNGLEMVYPLTYGRAQLGDIVSKATSDDSPINPGETIVLQIREAPYGRRGYVKGGGLNQRSSRLAYRC